MNLQDFHSRPEVTDTIAQSVQTVLAQIGEDPNRYVTIGEQYGN